MNKNKYLNKKYYRIFLIFLKKAKIKPICKWWNLLISGVIFIYRIMLSKK